MQMKNIFGSVIIGLLIFASCEKENGNETKVSQSFSSASHNTGKNCMECHKSGGDGAGWFTIAGSAYDSTQNKIYPNGTVQLATMPGNTGSIVKNIEIDSKGNFYSTESLDFGDGLYVSVLGTKGEQKYMNSKITQGACNMCHGNSTDKIWLK